MARTMRYLSSGGYKPAIDPNGSFMWSETEDKIIGQTNSQERISKRRHIARDTTRIRLLGRQSVVSDGKKPG